MNSLEKKGFLVFCGAGVLIMPLTVLLAGVVCNFFYIDIFEHHAMVLLAAILFFLVAALSVLLVDEFIISFVGRYLFPAVNLLFSLVLSLGGIVLTQYKSIADFALLAAVFLLYCGVVSFLFVEFVSEGDEIVFSKKRDLLLYWTLMFFGGMGSFFMLKNLVYVSFAISILAFLVFFLMYIAWREG